LKIGLFFGSFNPIHIGHLIIGNYIAETTDLDKVWFVVSPHNPLKERSSLLNEFDRLNLVNLAIEGNDNLWVSNIEFFLPKPSYTIDTLTHLKEKYPEHEFSLIMGSDNINNIHKWKNFQQILDNHQIFVYNRKGDEQLTAPVQGKIYFLDMPLLDISSTFIREAIKQGFSMRYFLPEAVYKYINEMNYYKS
jgi:nicotinate-nucleotide adenylyltransferase